MARRRGKGHLGDFFQNGVIATLHDLAGRPGTDLDAELSAWSESGRRMALILPCLYSELDGPALSAIVDEISEIPYLHEVIIGLDRADEHSSPTRRSSSPACPSAHRLLWNDGPRLPLVDADLARNDQLAPSESGKGRNVWYCMGYFLGSDAGRGWSLCTTATSSPTSAGSSPGCSTRSMHPTFDYSFCEGLLLPRRRRAT